MVSRFCSGNGRKLVIQGEEDVGNENDTCSEMYVVCEAVISIAIAARSGLSYVHHNCTSLDVVCCVGLYISSGKLE
jgi:hypothetical protein